MKKILLLSIVLWFASVFTVSATHVAGAVITYKHAVADSFDITLIVYRDCNGVNLPNDNIKITTACKTFTKTLTLVSSRDVTGIPANCPVQSRCTGNYPYGVLEEIRTGRVRLGGDSCCKYTLSWDLCCRNTAITTGPSGYNFYIETKVDVCLAPTNSSPEFVATPRFLLQAGKDANINNQAVDADGDLITYGPVEPLADSVSLAPYSGPFSKLKPFTFLGFPNASLTKPAGYHFDSATGYINFRPTKINEVSTYAVKAYEWRKINGVWTIISEVTREIMGIILPAINTGTPTFTTITGQGGIINGNTSMGEIAICNVPGTYCSELAITDGDTIPDTLDISYRHNLSNISFTNVGTLQNPIIRVCYTPDSAELAGGKPMRFIMEVSDGGCPLANITEKLFTFKPGAVLPDSFGLGKSLTCAHLSLTFNNTSSVSSPDYNWDIISPFGVTNSSSASPFNSMLTDSGWSRIKLSVHKDGYCNIRTYSDSIFLPTTQNLEVKVSPDTVVCFNPNITLNSVITNGAAPFTFAWSTGSITDVSAVVLAPGVNTYTLEITDANGCKATDAVRAEYYNPQVVLSGDSVECSGRPVTIIATPTALKPKYSWTGFSNNTAMLTDVPSASRQYELTLTDSAGCKVIETWNVTIHKPDLQFGHDSTICANDSIRLAATGSGSAGPYTFAWAPVSKTGSNVVLPPAGIAGTVNFNATVTDTYGCTKTKTSSIVVFSLPLISITPIRTYCEDESAVNLNSSATPTGGTWSGTAVSAGTFTPSTAGPGNHTLKYDYTETSTGCSNAKTTSIMVQQKPAADFTATKTIGTLPETFSFINTSTGSQTGYEWNFGDPGSGASNTAFSQNAAHVFSDTGWFTITLTTTGNGACAADVETKTNYIRVTRPTGIHDVVKNGLKIYPNPAKEKVFIETDREIAFVEVYDITGRQVGKYAGNATRKAEVPLQGLQAGNYILKVITGDNAVVTAPLVITQ